VQIGLSFALISIEGQCLQIRLHRALKHADWPAAGLMDTEIRCFLNRVQLNMPQPEELVPNAFLFTQIILPLVNVASAHQEHWG
jgi:hypothetical protein